LKFTQNKPDLIKVMSKYVKPKALVINHEQYGKHKPALHDCSIIEHSTYNLEL